MRRNPIDFIAPKSTQPPASLALGLLGLLVGSVCTYFADPVSGRRRRSTAKQKLANWSRLSVPKQPARRLRDLRNRAQGMAHQWQVAHGHDEAEAPADQKLVARVRSTLGHVTEHPHAISVSAKSGHVTLSGQVDAMVHRQVVRDVRNIRGVHDVTDRLSLAQQDHARPPSDDAHEAADASPSTH